MPTSKKIALVAMPVGLLLGMAALLIYLRGRDNDETSSWMAVAGVVLAAGSLAVSWFAWLRPVSAPMSSSSHAVHDADQMVGAGREGEGEEDPRRAGRIEFFWQGPFGWMAHRRGHCRACPIPEGLGEPG